MNKAIGFVVGTLAVKRLTRLVIEDKITEDLREKWFTQFPPETTKLGYLITCPKCVSIWAATALAAFRYGPEHRIVQALAMSEATILLYDAMDRATYGPKGFTDNDTLFN